MNKKRRITLIPSIADLFFVLISLLLFFTHNPVLLQDCDTGYHIRAGDYIIRTHSIPRFDIFSLHTPPIPWVAHEWLSEVVMAAIHSGSGLAGVVAVFAITAALTIALLFKALRAQGADVLTATAVTFLALTCCQLHWLARPHLFSLLLTVIFHYLLESWHRGGANRLYLLPPLMFLWVNLHGGFLGGFILLAAYLTGYLFTLIRSRSAEGVVKLRQLLLVTGGCLLACAANPQGLGILFFPFRLISDGYIMDHVNEFMSPNFHDSVLLPFRILLLLVIMLLALSRKKLDPSEIFLLLVFGNMSLYSVRYIPLFALVTAPMLARKLDDLRETIGGRVGAFLRQRSDNLSFVDAGSTGHLWSAAAVVLVAVTVVQGKFPHNFDAKKKAVGAGEFLMTERIAGNMFNNDEIGDYLIYRTHPYYKVFFDGRSDMYGAERMKEYKKIVSFEPGWESVLEKYGITMIVYDTNSYFSRFLLRNQQWKLIYSDKVASVFVKDVPQYHQLIEKYSAVKLPIPDEEKTVSRIW